MTVCFHAPEVSRAFVVDMANGTGRVVLALLGRSTQWLNGTMPVGLLKSRLAAITPEVIAKHAVPGKELAPGQYDCGTPEPWLASRIEGLRQLALECERVGAETVHWG